jgi:hypothetical protein
VQVALSCEHFLQIQGLGGSHGTTTSTFLTHTHYGLKHTWHEGTTTFLAHAHEDLGCKQV